MILDFPLAVYHRERRASSKARRQSQEADCEATTCTGRSCFAGRQVHAWTAPRQPRQSSGDDAAKEVVLIGPTGARLSVEKSIRLRSQDRLQDQRLLCRQRPGKKKVIDGEPVDVAIMLLPTTTPTPPATPRYSVDPASHRAHRPRREKRRAQAGYLHSRSAETDVARGHGHCLSPRSPWRRIRAQRGRHAHQAGDHGSNDAQNQLGASTW